MDNVSDRGDQFARLPADGFARFHDDGQVRVAAVELRQDAHEFFAVVVLAGNVVAAAEVYPFHLRQVLAEMLFESLEYAFQCVGVLFAEGVEVETFNAIQEFRFELRFGNAESRKLAARVVQVCFDGRKLRVHADSCAHSCGKGLVLETLPLAEAVEGNMACACENLVNFVVFVNGGEHMDFLAHFFFGESRFVQARGGCACKVFPDEREGSPKAVTF